MSGACRPAFQLQSVGTGLGASVGLPAPPKIAAQDPFGQFFQAHGLWPSIPLSGVRTSRTSGRPSFHRKTEETSSGPEQERDQITSKGPEAAQTPIDAGLALRLWSSQSGTAEPMYQRYRYGQGTAAYPPGERAQGPLCSPVRPIGAWHTQTPGIGKAGTMAF